MHWYDCIHTYGNVSTILPVVAAGFTLLAVVVAESAAAAAVVEVSRENALSVAPVGTKSTARKELEI